jgi:hypothetical protein
MAEKITYGIVGVGTYALMAIAFGYPFSHYAFFAGIISILVELEDYGFHRHSKSPLTHSLPFAAIWTVCTYLILAATGSNAAFETTMAIASAFISHFVLDGISKEGIFGYPRDLNIKGWLIPLPRHSEKAWASWAILPEKQWRESKGRDGSDPILNIGSTALCMAIIVISLA